MKMNFANFLGQELTTNKCLVQLQNTVGGYVEMTLTVHQLLYLW